MPLTAGIIGLPNVGKSTLFNAITKAGALAANYPFATIEPNVGVVTVPDDRVDFMTDVYKPKKTIYTTFEFTDIAGLVKGASKGEGLGNQFLSHIRNVDAICHVVRCFDNDDITHVDGSIDPVRDADTVNLELIFADLEVIEKRISKIEKKAKLKADKEAEYEFNILSRIHEQLLDGKPARFAKLTKLELEFIKNFSLLTMKPMIYIANVDESEVANVGDNKYVNDLLDFAEKEHSKVIVISAQIEAELSELSEEEKSEFLLDLGIEESGLNLVIKTAYSILGLKTFLTGGPDEVRAWTFKEGMRAPECAGVIHTDFQKGFIKAAIFSFDDLVQFGSEPKVKEAGKIRLEGKEYVMQDGDIVHFRFNV